MTRDELVNEYFEWMIGLVQDRRYSNHRRLLEILHTREFYYVIPMDRNRAVDGVNLRSRFAYECGHTERNVGLFLGGSCSVLEMMVALACRCEDNIMGDPDMGDRTNKWFWIMIVNLGLEVMTNDNLDIAYIHKVIDRLLERRYTKTGVGGLFCVKGRKEDLREVEIWYQMNWYLNETVNI